MIVNILNEKLKQFLKTLEKFSFLDAIKQKIQGLENFFYYLNSFFLYLSPLLFTFYILTLLFPLPPEKPFSKAILDRNGEFLNAYLAEDEIWRLRTSPDEIPEKLKKIIIAKEDKYFYWHFGINPISIIRALVQNIFSGKIVSGASTITMQTARMLNRRERTYLNKLYEAFYALQLEMKYSKNEILEIYLSNLPLGGNIEGLESAALIYYQTPLERLNIAQLFDMILIPNDPNRFRPDKFPERLFTERKRRAARFIRNKLLSEKDSIIIFNSPPKVERKSFTPLAPHLCNRLFFQSDKRDIIKTTIDISIQKKAEQLLQNHIRFWKTRGVKNGAVLIIDNSTRETVAYLGSHDFNDSLSHGQVDAIRAIRSPGSTLKPFLYALLFDRGELTTKTRLLDVPYDAEGFYAENYDGNYSGLVYADDALRRSLNVPMIRALKRLGVDRFIEKLIECGFKSIVSQEKKLGLSLILGGCGVSLEELTNAYCSFPNGGEYKTLKYFYEENKEETPRRVFDRSSAFLVTEILSGVNRPDLPNNFESAMNLPKIAFKTGTSYGRRDAWCVGYSSQYTVGVWIGNASGTGNPDLVGANSAAPLLIDILNAVSHTKRKEILAQPPDISVRKICVLSGRLPNENCSDFIDDYFSRVNTLNIECDFHKEYLVSTDGGMHYCPSCLSNNSYRKVIFEDYPPELIDFWNKSGKAFNKIPPHNPNCPRLFTGEGPKIISPADNMIYYILSEKQKLTLYANSPLDASEHYWHIDDKFMFKTKANEKVFVKIIEGEHTVKCIDDKGRQTSAKFIVKNLY